MAIYTSVSDFIALLSEGGRFVIQEEIHFAQGDIASNHVLPIADNSTIVFGYYRQWIYDGFEWIEPKGVIMPENI